MKSSILKNKIFKFTQNPGVYIFKNKNGDILYVGKATNLRSRVGSYFSLSPSPSPRGRGGNYSRPIEAMIHEVADIKTIQTDSVLEALILESNLIKQHQPKYNVKEKDDKSFSYFVITKEKFPRVIILRKTELSPHPASGSPRYSSDEAGHPLPRLGERVGMRVGKTFGPYTSKKQMEIALKIIRKIFPFHSGKLQTEKGCLDFQLGRCPGPYSGAISAEDYKKNIRGIRMILEGKKKNLVKKLEREMKDFSKKHEYEKAGEMRNKVFALKHIQDVALISGDMKREIRNTQHDSRIEAYDISNISGQYATGSMVVFKNSEPDKAQYRKFKIKTIEGADDVGMMREILLRRFKNAWSQPELIFLDGGKGHLNMGERLLTELGLVIPIVAVAKGPTRKISNFQFLISNQIPMSKIPKEIINVIRNKNLIKQIMDEAHRFAIRYHRQLRKNGLLA
ncbi:MAG TPA: GIY-YIG nuclease family protein [Patescibacteria group bacterium]